MSRQRSIITPEHFVVAPELLGMPLASPSRRAYAMAIDLLLVAILLKAGGVLLGLVAATVLFRASKPDPRSGFLRRSVRTSLRILGALILFFVIYRGFGSIKDRIAGKEEASEQQHIDESGNLKLNLSANQIAGLAGPMFTLRKAEDSASVFAASLRFLESAKSAGASPADLRDSRAALVELVGSKADAARLGAIDEAVRRVAGEPPRTAAPDTTLRYYINALEHSDSAAAPAWRDSIKQALAGPEIATLESRAQKLDQRGDSLQKELAAARKSRGIRTFIAGAADDLGVGFGWSAVYFTAFLALWRGQTPGKRLARVRVLRLDGEPLGWWMSFERFGGYAASFSVGLMGFLQILWDRNRQGLHDKACETVVVKL